MVDAAKIDAIFDAVSKLSSRFDTLSLEDLRKLRERKEKYWAKHPEEKGNWPPLKKEKEKSTPDYLNPYLNGEKKY